MPALQVFASTPVSPTVLEYVPAQPTAGFRAALRLHLVLMPVFAADEMHHDWPDPRELSFCIRERLYECLRKEAELHVNFAGLYLPNAPAGWVAELKARIAWRLPQAIYEQRIVFFPGSNANLTALYQATTTYPDCLEDENGFPIYLGKSVNQLLPLFSPYSNMSDFFKRLMAAANDTRIAYTLIITPSKADEGQATISVVPTMADKRFTPFNLSGTIDQLDTEFLSRVEQQMAPVGAIITNGASQVKEVAKAVSADTKAATKATTPAAKTAKAAPTTPTPTAELFAPEAEEATSAEVVDETDDSHEGPGGEADNDDDF